MALLWIDGFDHYRDTDGNLAGLLNGAYVEGSQAASYTTDGLVGGCYTRTMTQTAQSAILKALPSTYTSLGVGFHYFNSARTRSACIVTLTNNTGATALTSLVQNIDGTLSIVSGNTNGTVRATTSMILDLNEWYHIEFFAEHNGSSSTAEVRINGQTAATYSGTLTSTAIGGVRLGWTFGTITGTTSTSKYDNFYIWDTSGTENNTWIGEKNVYTLTPNGDTAQADWALSGGSDGYDLIDNIPAVVTDYIESTTVGDKSQFALQGLPSTDITIIGIQVNAYAQKTGTSDTSIELGLVSDSVETTGSPHFLFQDEWRYFSEIFDEDPSTNAPWDPNDIVNVDVFVERTQ